MQNEINYYNYDRHELLPFLGKPNSQSKILEIGCATGKFRNYFHNECDYWGVEPSPEAAQQATFSLSRVLTGTFREKYCEIPDNYFDYVICNDVIEHMDDHDWFLQKIKEKMVGEAVIIGSIPNVRYIENILNLLFRKEWKYVEAGVLDRTHLRFFTERSLKRTLVENGYIIEQFSGINHVSLSWVNSRRLLMTGVASLSYFLFGSDTRYVQFAFRARKAPNIS
jgi:2-polyprenyl-3-methyl-5-hydroxy-6-metoxy-1,4-benzoquinol methylase